MALLTEFEELSIKERQYRYFSESFKKKKVSEIERNFTTVREISRTYQVSSTAVYKWLYKYSSQRKKGIRQVIEMKSDTKKILFLEEKVKELEQIIGQKQILLDFQEKLIELASEEVGFDIKKKHGSKPKSTSGKIVQK